MYLWKIDSLVNDFRSGKVSQQEEFKYILLFTIAVTLTSDPAIHIDSSYNCYDTIDSVMTLAIAILGVYCCYKINSSGDNKDFIVRVMCIGLPVMIRVLTAMIPIFVLGGIIESEFIYPEPFGGETTESTPLPVALISAFEAVYYWHLSVKIKAVSSERA
jgi:hypothetical protein